jgi:glycosyltransferase involved in cell wall biosynthesis
MEDFHSVRKARVPAVLQDVGIVVIGRNEGVRLSSCLSSLPPISNVVYVDSGSTDGSSDLARSWGADVVELDSASPYTAARARNAGFKRLAATRSVDFVQFVDGDTTLAEEWLESGVAFLVSKPEVAAVVGLLNEEYSGASIYQELCGIEWSGPTGLVDYCGGTVLIRAAAFRLAGGYREDLKGGEEPELCLRIRESGNLIWKLAVPMGSHHADMRRFAEWWRRTARGGYAFAEVSHLHRHSPARIWRHECRRALAASLALPAICIAGAVLHPSMLALLVAYPLQIIRIALLKRELPRPWLYASFMVLAKFAEAFGIMKFHVNRVFGKRRAESVSPNPMRLES